MPRSPLNVDRYVQETPLHKRLEDRRDKVRSLVRRGINPREEFTDDALAELFDPDEIIQLDTERIEGIKSRQEARRQADLRRSLADETKSVLAEWDAQRRREAEVEARRRLGIEEDD
jgi:hypothetical protein